MKEKRRGMYWIEYDVLAIQRVLVLPVTRDREVGFEMGSDLVCIQMYHWLAQVRENSHSANTTILLMNKERNTERENNLPEEGEKK